MARRLLPLVLAFALLVPATAGADTSSDPPIADPIPTPITMSGLDVRLEHVVTIPATGSAPVTRINGATHAGDGSGRLFVPDMRGEIFVVVNGAPSVFLDVTATLPDFTDAQGLSSGLSWVTFHPDFATNGRFYTAHTEDGAALTSTTPDFAHQLGRTIDGVITEWTATTPSANTFSGARRELMRIGFVSNFHGVQQIEFGPDGYLYIGVGDGDSTTFSTGAQSLDWIQGSLLRIDVDGTNSANGEYGIPATNPNAASPGLDEIFARGFRNPHRFTWDGPSGKLLLGNIGQNHIESIYDVFPGANHGWNEREGAFLWDPANPDNVYPLPAGDAAFGYTYPVAMYDHDEGFAIVGGHVHRHPSVPELYGQYVFGDISRGRIFHAAEADMSNGTTPAAIGEVRLFDETDTEVTLLDLSPVSRVDLRFGLEEDGRMLITSKQTGDIYRITDRTPEPLPTVAAGNVTVNETPGGVVASIPLTLSVATPLPVSVDVATFPLAIGETGADPDDYVAASGTATFPPLTTAATFDVTITDDLLDEFDELVAVELTDPVNAIVGGFLGLGFATIVDDDASPVTTAGAIPANPEGDSGSAVFDLPVTLDAPSGRTVTIDWSMLAVPSEPTIAIPGVDVADTTGTLTFAPGETVQYVPVEVLGDTIAEPPLLWGEWALVQLSSPVHTTIDVSGLFGLGIVIIVDDD